MQGAKAARNGPSAWLASQFCESGARVRARVRRDVARQLGFRDFARRINGSRSSTLPCHSRLPARLVSSTLDVSLMITPASRVPNGLPPRQQEKSATRSILVRGG